MEQNTQLRHTLIYGGIGGAIVLFINLMLYIFGMMNNQSLSNIGSIIFVIMIYFSVRHYRDRQLDGFIDFGKAFSTGILTALVMGIIGMVYNYILYKYMAPGLINDMLVMMEERLIEKGLPDDQIEMQSKLMNQFMSAGLLAFGILFSAAFWGALVSLLWAAVLKKQNNPLLMNDNQE